MADLDLRRYDILPQSIYTMSRLSDFVRQRFGSVTISYVSVASLTLLSCDLLLNVGAEYHHIWKSKWSLIKCLYLWSRYGPFIDTTIAMLRGSGAVSAEVLFGVALTSCNTLTKFNTVFSIFGIGVTEVILIIRTYTLYGSSKKSGDLCVVVWLVYYRLFRIDPCRFLNFVYIPLVLVP
ncbi:hypothetical protein B0H11DRAFT_2258542 [Mycena galericulata]|nr:hypothetical protein B0H11DRAFT_2258542 [Mycena galericulata]